jgi:hypothetical protein
MTDQRNTIPPAPAGDEQFKRWYIDYHGFLHSVGQGCPSCDRYYKLTGVDRDNRGRAAMQEEAKR